MQTITFYSYKGGLGRTLAVANMARYLSLFGKNVFAIDFDLEAPGLHYKLRLGGGEWRIERGLVDYIDAFLLGKEPERLQDYVIEVEGRTPHDGSIHLLPAGAVPSLEYWQKLARINWHDLFYSEDAKGIPFFLELKAQIAEEFAPDYLLIDARTGITEVGGVATTLLANTVVCLLLNNGENLEGAREVLRGIRRAPRLPGQTMVEIVPVVARLPELGGQWHEENVLEEVRTFLNEEAADLVSTLSVEKVLVLHAELELQLRESLRIGDARGPKESILYRDYLHLFTRLIPHDIRTYLEPLIGKDVEQRARRKSRRLRDYLRMFTQRSLRKPVSTHSGPREENRQYRDVVSNDVFRAVLGRVVSEPVLREIQDILKTDVIRTNCLYRIVFKRPHPGMPPGYFVLQRDLAFEVTNVRDKSTTFPLRSSYSGEAPALTFLKLSVNERVIALKEGENLKEEGTIIEELIHLAPLEAAKIFFRTEEGCPIDRGRNAYFQGTPVIGISVALINEYPDKIEAIEVRMLHPAAAETVYDPLGGQYLLNRAFLPGQGFEIRWKGRNA